ncbi:MAG TPA: FIST N-terminal domain-containing protein [Acidimicrobiales bacterium]|nr:FIST N-terminal domain-containing protein [Acidimicrobiales bacterium]
MTRARAAAGLSEHPLTTHAVGEAVGAVLDELGPAPDLAAVFVTDAHAGALDDVTAAVRATLAPGVLIGAASTSVVGGHREIEGRPAVVVWAARLGPVEPVRVRAERQADGWAVTGVPTTAMEPGRTLVLLADPFTFPAEPFVDQLGDRAPGLAVVGGLTSGAEGAGGMRLALDGAIHAHGAVGALLPADADIATVVSQGCRPIGDPLVVTRAERNLILELGGRPALDVLRDVLVAMSPEEREVASRGLQVGWVIDEHRDRFERGDFLVRSVLGVDSGTGGIAVGHRPEVGRTAQLHVRDAATADDDLRHHLAGRRASGALVFTCTGRGAGLFGVPDHDADLISSALGTRATAGMFAAGELGPVGGRSFVHGFTASMLLVAPRAASGGAAAG